MIYLASPYSHPDPAVRERRYQAVFRAALTLMRGGEQVFSPIVYSHQFCKAGLPMGWEYWEDSDREHIDRCSEMVVLKLDGHEQSVGVIQELRIAHSLGKPVTFMDPQPPDDEEERKA